jgi:hypothetical protein
MMEKQFDSFAVFWRYGKVELDILPDGEYLKDSICDFILRTLMNGSNFHHYYGDE